MTTLDPPRTLVGAPDPDEPHDSAGDQPSRDDQCRIVAGGPSSLDGHACDGAQRRAAVEGPNSAARHMTTDTHRAFADGGSRPLDGRPSLATPITDAVEGSDSASDQIRLGAQPWPVAGGPRPLDDQEIDEAHRSFVAEGSNIDPGQSPTAAQTGCTGVDRHIRDDHRWRDAHSVTVVAEQSPPAPATEHATPNGGASGLADPDIDHGDDQGAPAGVEQYIRDDQGGHAAQRPAVVAEQSPPGAAMAAPTPIADAPRPADPNIDSGHGGSDARATTAGVEQSPPGATMREPTPSGSASRPVDLDDPFLKMAADVLDDLERVRVANENRLRQLTRTATDADGEDRGFGLDERHPDVARLSALVDALRQAEHDAELQLGRTMRRHPLYPWVKATVGIGIKQGARLLAAIGDPYIRPELIRKDGTVEPSRPRRVSELWAYTGYHVLRSGQSGDDNQSALAGAAGGDDPGHRASEAHTRGAGVAPTPRRGQRCNWSTSAKMRAFLIAESCVKQTASPYRVVYDEGRVKYADAVHATECRRCGPSGHPAAAGSPLSAGHQHARALRLVAKRVLRDLWRESRALHQAAAS